MSDALPFPMNFRRAALTFLRLAREYREHGNLAERDRLACMARQYWHFYLRGRRYEQA